MAATLLDGSFHERDSSTLAFELAAMAAFREGFAKASPQALEPVMAVEVITPADYLGDAIGEPCVFRSLLDSGNGRSWTFNSALVVTSKSRM